MERIMIDLCSGLGGASQAMKDRNWKIIRIDIDEKFKPDIVADVRKIQLRNIRPLLIWASPPCTDFSIDFLPWIKTENKPDLSIMIACKNIIDYLSPIYWRIENVKGAVKWFKPILGNPTKVINPYYLWGNAPNNFTLKKMNRKNKSKYSSIKKAERAKIPYELSLATALSIEANMDLFDGY